MNQQVINWQALSAQEQKNVLARPAIANNALLSTQVNNILAQVKTKGDQALFDFTEKFDGISLNTLKVTNEQIQAAKHALSSTRLAAIKTAYRQIKCFHDAQKPQDISVETTPGVRCILKTESIASVGLYIPAGSAPLPSTVLMLGVPAQIANCPRVVLVCPPDKKGQLANEILAAADLCGISEIYTVGGAQAIAALAYGTETIKSVNKVFGPGNRYVTEAKKQLSQQVAGFAIDMPAGPSELLIIGDSRSNPAFIAADLLSQAEHGIDSQVILLTDSNALIDAVNNELDKQVVLLSRQKIAKKSLAHSRLVLVNNIEQAIEVSNEYGPEHLIIQTQEPQTLLARLRNAGSIFVGAYTPESAGDYASGTNHVLPTYGYSKVISSLSLADFSRRYTVQELTREGLASLADCIIELTDAEGLDAHQRAVTIRLEDSK
ncbi:MAG: histidinol dehydrogenase [Alteromonadaceae bacterium]|nr:histidinol dehydrogenase [Alteromonadaceae bacterium]